MKRKVRIPDDAFRYLKFDDAGTPWVNWEKMYLDKIRETPERAAELMKEFDARKNMWI